MRHYTTPNLMMKGFIQGGKLKRDAIATGHHKYCTSLVQLASTGTLSRTTSSWVSSWQTIGLSITSEQQTACLFESLSWTTSSLVSSWQTTGSSITSEKDIRLWPFILAGLALVLVYHQCIRDSNINTGAMIPFTKEITLYHESTTVRFPANTVILLVIFLILILNYFLGVFELCYPLRHFFVLTRYHPVMIHYENCIS